MPHNALQIDRSKLQDKLEGIVYSILHGRHNDALDAMGDEMLVNRLGPGFFHEMAMEFDQEIVKELTQIYMLAAGAQADDFDFVIDSGDLEYDATTWAVKWAEQLSLGIAEVTQDRLAKISFLSRDDSSRQPIYEALDSLFGVDRATKIAITEVTRGIQAGKSDIVKRLLDEFGIECIGTWQCNSVEPCERYCAPLHGKTQEVWQKEFPDGAPCHPSCNCEILWTIKD